MKRFLIFFGQMFFSYALITVNMRAVQNVNYLAVLGTDALIAFNSFFLTKRIGESKSRVELAGYLLGGLAGSMMALYLATHMFKV